MTYEYKCNDCGAQLEIYASIAEKEQGLRVECPACGGSKVTQVFTKVNVVTRSGRSGGVPPCCGPGSGSGAGCC